MQRFIEPMGTPKLQHIKSVSAADVDEILSDKMGCRLPVGGGKQTEMARLTVQRSKARIKAFDISGVIATRGGQKTDFRSLGIA
jgi:hypothetical protein